MVKTRILLGLLTCALLTIQGLLGRFYVPDPFDMVIRVLDLVLLLAAVGILVFTLFRIQETPAGDYCFDPANPWWKLMAGAFEWKSGRVSLCRAYWSTVLIVAAATACMTFFGVVLFAMLPKVAVDVYDYCIAHSFIEVVHQIAMGIGFITVGGLGMAGIAFLCDKYKLFGKIFLSSIVLVLVGFILIAPPVDMAARKHITYSRAAMLHAEHIAIFLACCFAAGLLLYAAFRWLPALKNTWLGKIIPAAKAKVCPTLVACANPHGSYAG